MSERLLIRTLDGPSPGVRVSDGYFGWPLPEILVYPREFPLPDAYDMGYYQKVSESCITSSPGIDGFLRGAQYEWRTGEPPEQGQQQPADQEQGTAQARE